MDFSNLLSELLEKKNRLQQFSGVVLIKHGTDELFKAAYSDAHKSWEIKNQIDTRFRIASVSKLFTAVAILQLIDDQKINLGTRIIDCLGLEDTTIPSAVTIEHLLTMTAGIADWFDESGNSAEDWAALCHEYPIYQFRRNEDYLPLFAHKTPVTSVGQQHQYNNASYILLGLAIAKLSGLLYFDYVKTHIFVKLGMTNSDFVALDGIDKNVAEGYIPLTNTEEKIIGWRKNIYSATPEAAADGGAISTVEDLARFTHALRTGQLLSAEMTSAILSPKVLEDDEPYEGYFWKYGYGNQFLEDESGRIVRWGHTGEEEGVSCRLYHYPQKDIDIIILANQSECAGSLGWEIHDLIFEHIA